MDKEFDSERVYSDTKRQKKNNTSRQKKIIWKQNKYKFSG